MVYLNKPYKQACMDKLREDFDYFVDNHDELFRQYPNRYLVIKDKRVVYDEGSFEEALNRAAVNGMNVGTFIIQYCTEGDSAYTQTFHSRAVF